MPNQRTRTLTHTLALTLTALTASQSVATPTALTFAPLPLQDVPAAAIELTQARPLSAPGDEGGGRVVDAKKWTDAQGESLLLLTERKTEKSGASALRLVAYRLTRPTTSAPWVVAWRARDWLERCEFDLVGGYFLGDVHVTDLNADGVAEVTFGYDIDCVSSLDPRSMKVLSYEGVQKQALRGVRAPKALSGLAIPPREYVKGAPKALLELMRGVWERHHLYSE